MSYTVCNTLDFGPAYTGATLNAQLVDVSRNPVGSAITTGIDENSGGLGLFDFALTVPDGHQGWCHVYVQGASSTILASLPLNPAELENADVKTSTRSTFSGGAVASVTGDVGGNVVGSVGSLATQAKADVNAEADTALSDAGVTTTVTGRIDAAISSRLADADYAAPDNAGVAAIKVKTDNLPADPADASDIAASFSAITTALTTIAGYIDTEIAAIKAKTDNLPAAPAAVSDIPTTTAINTALAVAHGAGSWATATGFATPTNVTTAQTVITAAIAALHNLSTGDIDARLTAYDGATQADLDTAKAAVLAAIAALNNLSSSQAQSAAAAALSAYDGPTKAELDVAQAAIQTDIAGIEGGGGGGGSTPEQFWTYPDRTLTRFGRLTGVEFTYTVTSSANGLPIPSVAVWFAADGGGTQIVWSGHTDALGIARDVYGALPRLDPGTYYVFRRRPGYIFRNPDTEIVNE